MTPWTPLTPLLPWTALRIAAVAIVCAALVAAASPRADDDETLLAVEPAALLPLDNENRLIVGGFRGTLEVLGSNEGEMRYEASREGDEGEGPLPVEVWHRGRTVRLAPGAESAEERYRLRVFVDPKMRLLLEADDSAATVRSLVADTELRGKALAASARGIDGSVRVRIEGGSFVGRGIAGGLNLELKQSTADAELVSEGLYAHQEGGTLEAEQVSGEVDLDLERVDLTLTTVQDKVYLVARSGSARIGGARDGGELQLTGTTLSLDSCEGTWEIETDAAVGFASMKAALHVNSYGGAVRGRSNEGSVEVRTDGSAVQLERVAGPVTVAGAHLALELNEIAGDLAVLARSSEVVVRRASGPVSIQNDRGNVTVDGASNGIKVVSTDGNVSVSGLIGPADVSADGPQVSVAWQSFGSLEDSWIRNTGGDVAVQLPPRGGCRLEAHTSFGQVESDVAGVRVSGDGHTASGILRRRSKPRVRVESDNWIRLTGGS